jgi:hypothetical protein
MTRDQRIVAIGAASGVLAMLASVATLYQFVPANPGLADLSARLGYTLEMNAFAILPLLVRVMLVANQRFLSEAIDPTLHQENLAMQVDGRVVDNTLQQSMLFLIGTLALSVNLAGPQMKVITAAMIVFVVARVAFWIGYRIHPLYRAFGMAATGYLNVGILVSACWEFLRA